MCQQGYVYILTNDSFHDNWVKIGKSSRPVDIRSKELDNTAVPLPFNIFATLKTKKYSEVERLVHKMIDRLTDLRIRQNREFFNVEPQVALDILRDIATVLDDAEIKVYEIPKSQDGDAQAGSDSSTYSKKPPFKFSMAGIKTGEVLTFDPTGIEVKVVSDNQIEYQDRIYKLSPFVGTFLPEDQQSPSRQYQGPKYFSYKGKTLTELREELEGAEE